MYILHTEVFHQECMMETNQIQICNICMRNSETKVSLLSRLWRHKAVSRHHALWWHIMTVSTVLSENIDVFPPWFLTCSPDSDWMAGHQLVLEIASQLQGTYCSYRRWLHLLKDQTSLKNSRSETAIKNKD